MIAYMRKITSNGSCNTLSQLWIKCGIAKQQTYSETFYSSEFQKKKDNNLSKIQKGYFLRLLILFVC